MKSLYVTSVERHSGKTATCLALGKRLLADGYKVGYLKPLSLQPWRVGGKLTDEDAAFVKESVRRRQYHRREVPITNGLYLKRGLECWFMPKWVREKRTPESW